MSITESIYILMFISGFFGGFGHCLGMCGPVVASYTLAFKGKSLAPHLFYNLGRITTYALLGGIVGAAGSFASIVGRVQGIQKFVMALSGVVVIIMGLWMAGLVPAAAFLKNKTFTSLNCIRFIEKLSVKNLTVGSFYPIGVFLGFIPCGLVYAALITAARVSMDAKDYFSGFFEGIGVMLLFGLGTLPAVLLFGRAISVISEKMRIRLYRFSALFMVVTGLIFIIRLI